MAGESSRSSDRRRAAAARKSGLAKIDHLPSQLAVGTGSLRCTGVHRDRPPGQWRLAELDRISDDAVEDVMVADYPQLVEHVAGQKRPAIVEGRQQAQDPEVAVEPGSNRVD